jgi:hypothetical protein
MQPLLWSHCFVGYLSPQVRVLVNHNYTDERLTFSTGNGPNGGEELLAKKR